VHVSRYSSFDVFCSALQYALDTVHSIVTLGLIERIGLRYVDVVRPSEGEELRQYLHPGLLGFNDADVGVRGSIRMSVYQGETDSGTLLFRLAQRNDRGFLPPDLEPSPLYHDQPEVRKGEIVTLLDTDHFRDLPRSSSIIRLKSYCSIYGVSTTTRLAFRAAVTPYALNAWGAEDRDGNNRNH